MDSQIFQRQQIIIYANCTYSSKLIYLFHIMSNMMARIPFQLKCTLSTHLTKYVKPRGASHLIVAIKNHLYKK